MRKSELKERIKELEYEAVRAHQHITSLENALKNKADELKQYQESSNTGWYIVRCLSSQVKKSVAEMILDTVMYRTHRERNENTREQVRWLINMIEKDVADWTTESQMEKSDMDDIPF